MQQVIGQRPDVATEIDGARQEGHGTGDWSIDPERFRATAAAAIGDGFEPGGLAVAEAEFDELGRMDLRQEPASWRR